MDLSALVTKYLCRPDSTRDAVCMYAARTRFNLAHNLCCSRDGLETIPLALEIYSVFTIGYVPAEALKCSI